MYGGGVIFALPTKDEVNDKLIAIDKQPIKDKEYYYFKGEGIDKKDKSKAENLAEKNAFSSASQAISTEVEVLKEKKTTISKNGYDEIINEIINSSIKIKSHNDIKEAVIAEKIVFQDKNEITCKLILRVPIKEIELTRKAIDKFEKTASNALSKNDYNTAIQFLEGAVALDNNYLPPYINLIKAYFFRFRQDEKFSDLEKMCDLLCNLDEKAIKQKVTAYDKEIATYKHKITNSMQRLNTEAKGCECVKTEREHTLTFIPTLLGGASIPISGASDALKLGVDLSLSFYVQPLKDISFGLLVGFSYYDSKDDIRPATLRVIPIAGLAKYNFGLTKILSLYGELGLGVSISLLKQDAYYALEEVKRNTISIYTLVRLGVEIKPVEYFGINIGTAYSLTGYEGRMLHGIWVGGGAGYYF